MLSEHLFVDKLNFGLIELSNENTECFLDFWNELDATYLYN